MTNGSQPDAVETRGTHEAPVRHPGWAVFVGVATAAGTLVWVFGIMLAFAFSGAEYMLVDHYLESVSAITGAVAFFAFGMWGAWALATGRRGRSWLWPVGATVAALGIVVVVGAAKTQGLIGLDPTVRRPTYDEINAVVALGPGLVAVGGDDTIPDSGAAVWTSSDGVTWTRAPHDEAVFGTHRMYAVTVGGPGLVAVGGQAAWVSSDGATWTHTHLDGAELNAVVAGGPGLVAVGSRGVDAAVWTSSDGIAWTQIPLDESLSGGEFSDEMRDVAVGPIGLVAVGVDVMGVGEKVAAAWTSADGITWNRAPRDQAAFAGGGGMTAVVAGGPGVVAVGWDMSGNAAVWTSPDGVSWTRVPHDPAVFSAVTTFVEMTAIAAGGPGFVAVGRDGSGDAVVWTSPDGMHWTRVYDESVFSGPETQEMHGVVGWASGLVAVGIDDSSAAVWTSPDGLTWTRVTPLSRP